MDREQIMTNDLVKAHIESSMDEFLEMIRAHNGTPTYRAAVAAAYGVPVDRVTVERAEDGSERWTVKLMPGDALYPAAVAAQADRQIEVEDVTVEMR